MVAKVDWHPGELYARLGVMGKDAAKQALIGNVLLAFGHGAEIQ